MKKGDPLERYSRHLLLKEIGGQGQQLLNKAKVLIIGLGGLGSPVLQYISGSGVGEIGLVDDDKVDISNLHRQPIYSMKDIGLYKVTQAKKFAHSINPNININIYKGRMTSRGTKNIIKDYDIIIDCTDNHLSSLAINDICFKEKKPLISASVAGFFGQVTTYRSFEFNENGIPNPSYRCLKINKESEENCESLGILGSVAGIIGSIQATEAIKQILGQKDNLVGRLLIFDGSSYAIRLIKIKWDPKNPLNGSS